MRIRAAATLTALLLCTALAGCGASGKEAGGTEASTVKVGVIPVADFAPLYVAQDQGIFDKHGVSVDLTTMQNAADIAPAVMNGQLQVGTTANVPFLTARSKGLPIVALTGSTETSGDPAKDYCGVFVSKGSGIEHARDLAGKTVATNALKAVLELVVSKAVKDDGGDPAAVQFVAMPFPNMVPALDKANVDAITVCEPFFSAAQNAGARLLFYPYTDALPRATSLSFLFTSKAWLDKSAGTAEKFAAAMDEANQYATEHPEAVRKAMVEHFGMDSKAAQNMRLPIYQSEVKPESLEVAAELMVEFGFIDKTPDPQGSVYGQ